MFNGRQLLGLGLLARRIRQVPDTTVRQALLTVFSDTLRYQNMLCRYDVYALKCQDIFSVHGFPVGLIQCENNLLGIPGVGSGSFVHFIEKYVRAKDYCRQPFETKVFGSRKRLLPIEGERIAAEPVDRFPDRRARQAWLVCGSADEVALPPDSLDGVFTDPPYFANVQYAELMDFCYVWLRQGLRDEFDQFQPPSTRSNGELTGNETLGRDLEHFAEGLSRVYQRFAAALKPDAPFVFTYHHNQLGAYAPVVLALLDAGLACTVVLPAPAEMSASLHINNTGSSILDSVFVARRRNAPATEPPARASLVDALAADLRRVASGGVKPTLGDARCLASGHLACVCVEQLRLGWGPELPLRDRLQRVEQALLVLAEQYEPEALATEALVSAVGHTHGRARGGELIPHVQVQLEEAEREAAL
jgi:adenine-specific DNA methylase